MPAGLHSSPASHTCSCLSVTLFRLPAVPAGASAGSTHQRAGRTAGAVLPSWHIPAGLHIAARGRARNAVRDDASLLRWMANDVPSCGICNLMLSQPLPCHHAGPRPTCCSEALWSFTRRRRVQVSAAFWVVCRAYRLNVTARLPSCRCPCSGGSWNLPSWRCRSTTWWPRCWCERKAAQHDLTTARWLSCAKEHDECTFGRTITHPCFKCRAAPTPRQPGGACGLPCSTVCATC